MTGRLLICIHRTPKCLVDIIFHPMYPKRAPIEAQNHCKLIRIWLLKHPVFNEAMEIRLYQQIAGTVIDACFFFGDCGGRCFECFHVPYAATWRVMWRPHNMYHMSCNYRASLDSPPAGCRKRMNQYGSARRTQCRNTCHWLPLLSCFACWKLGTWGALTGLARPNSSIAQEVGILCSSAGMLPPSSSWPFSPPPRGPSLGSQETNRFFKH